MAQPSASGMPPKTSGARTLPRASAVGVRRRGRGQDGIGHGYSWAQRGRGSAPVDGAGGRASWVRPRARSHRDPVSPAGRARSRDLRGEAGRRHRAEAKSGAAVGTGTGSSSVAAAARSAAGRLGRVDGHVVVQRGEQRADEGVGGLGLRGELGDAGARAEVDPDGDPDDAVVLGQPGDGEGDRGRARRPARRARRGTCAWRRGAAGAGRARRRTRRRSTCPCRPSRWTRSRTRGPPVREVHCAAW